MDELGFYLKEEEITESNPHDSTITTATNCHHITTDGISNQCSNVPTRIKTVCYLSRNSKR